MPYYSIIEKTKDHRINVLLTALAKTIHYSHSVPSEQRALNSIAHKISKQIGDGKEAVAEIESEMESMTVLGREAMEKTLSEAKHNILNLEKAKEKLADQREQIGDKATHYEMVGKEIENTLHKKLATIQTLSTSLSVTKYHGFNAFSENGQLNIGALKSCVDDLAKEHLDGAEVHIIQQFGKEQDSVEIDSYTRLFTFFYASQDMNKMSEFFDGLRDVLEQGKKEAFVRDVLASKVPEEHYYVKGSFERSDETDFESWLKDYAERDVKNQGVAYTVGCGEGDVLEKMIQEDVSFLDCVNSNSKKPYLYAPAQFATDNPRLEEWRNDAFGGKSGFDRTESGYEKVHAFTAQCWYEENPELAKQADKVVDSILASLGKSKDNEAGLEM